jgi:hypothetical protein
MSVGDLAKLIVERADERVEHIATAALKTVETIRALYT